MSTLERETGETRIRLSVTVAEDGAGIADVAIDDRFLGHMIETLARYGGLRIKLDAEGDLQHHLIEDVAITLGLALRDEIPERATRYGWATVPMDEALVDAAIDLGGRSWYEGRLPSTLYEHFLQSFATNLGATLHVDVRRGRDRHHIVEAAIKATGLALRQGLAAGSGEGVFSTKGSVLVERPAE
jgi:imidazoleglycerol-phosphate dehydratase